MRISGVMPRERIAEALAQLVVRYVVIGLEITENPKDNTGPVTVTVRQGSVEVPEDDLVGQG
jgi:hypothetical protein